MRHSDDRVVIPGGRLRPPRWRHLVPIARFLVEERGHLPIQDPERWGFAGMGVSWFSRRISEENDTGVYFEGTNMIIGLEGSEPIEIWEAKERALDRTYGRPDLGEGKAGPPVPSK